MSDAILHVVRHFDYYVKEAENAVEHNDSIDDIELLLSEYKL